MQKHDKHVININKYVGGVIIIILSSKVNDFKSYHIQHFDNPLIITVYK